MKGYSPDDWAAGTRRTAVDIGGVPQKLIESIEAPGLFVGYVDADGNVVPVGSDVTAHEFVDLVVANAAEAPEGWGDAPATESVPSPDATTTGTAPATAATDTGTGLTLQDVDIPPPDGGFSSSSGDFDDDGGYRSRRSYDDDDGYVSRSRRFSDDDDEGFDLTVEDFLRDFNDNGEIDDEDRKRARRAFNFWKRRRPSSSSRDAGGGRRFGFWEGFPFNRPPSPIRQHVLSALAEGLGRGSAPAPRSRR